MGLRAKFNLAMLAGFAVGLALAAALAWNITRDNARAEVAHEAALIITGATAARDYTASEVGPLLQDQTKIRYDSCRRRSRSLPLKLASATCRSSSPTTPTRKRR